MTEIVWSILKRVFNKCWQTWQEVKMHCKLSVQSNANIYKHQNETIMMCCWHRSIFIIYIGQSKYFVYITVCKRMRIWMTGSLAYDNLYFTRNGSIKEGIELYMTGNVSKHSLPKTVLMSSLNFSNWLSNNLIRNFGEDASHYLTYSSKRKLKWIHTAANTCHRIEVCHSSVYWYLDAYALETDLGEIALFNLREKGALSRLYCNISARGRSTLSHTMTCEWRPRRRLLCQI